MAKQEYTAHDKNPLSEVPPLVTIKTAAALLHTTRRSISRWIADGSLDAYKLSPGRAGKILIPRQALVAFLQERAT